MTESTSNKLIAEIKTAIHQHPDLTTMNDEQMRMLINNCLQSKIDHAREEAPELYRELVSMNFRDKRNISDAVYEAIRGLGVLGQIIGDEEITEVMINGYQDIFVEKKGNLQKLDKQFENRQELETIITKFVSQAGRIDSIDRDDTFYEKSGILHGNTSEGYQVLDYLGRNSLGMTFDLSEPLENVFVVYEEDNFPCCCGLVTADGEMLIPCETAGIENIYGGSRYLNVIFATEQVYDKNEAYLYFSDNLFSIFPGEDDIFYDGYSLVYDLQERRYVDGIRIDDPSISLTQVGSSILAESFKTNLLYGADGVLLSDECYYVGDSYIAGNGNESGEYPIYNDRMELVTNLAFVPSGVYANGTLFAVTDYDLTHNYEDDASTYYLVDQNGKRVSTLTFDYAPEQFAGFIYQYNEDGYYAVTDMAGDTLISYDQKYESFEECEGGILLLWNDDEMTVLYPDGTIVPLGGSSDMYQYGMNISRENQKQYELFALNQQTYCMTVNDVYFLSYDIPLVAVENEDGSLAIFDMLNGALLTEYQYSSVLYAGGYVYAQSENGWDVFRVKLEKE